jgi:hypothetical protein
MYSLIDWIDHRYHPSIWIRLGVCAFFVLGRLARPADKKSSATGSPTDTDRRGKADK